MNLIIQIDGQLFQAEFTSTPAARQLEEHLRQKKITLPVQDYGGWEKVASLPFILPAQDQVLTSNPGDIFLYQSNSIVFFYGNNRWAYTPLAKIKAGYLTAFVQVLRSDIKQITLFLQS